MSVRSDRSQLKRRSDHSATAWLERSSSYSAYAPSDLDSTGCARLLFTLSMLALQWASPDVSRWAAAAIVKLHISVLTLGVAAIARRYGLNIGIRHR